MERAIVNEYFNEETFDNDIGLWVLSSTIPGDINAKPIEISGVKDPESIGLVLFNKSFIFKFTKF